MKTYKSFLGLLSGAFMLVLAGCGGQGEQLSETEATGVMQAALTASTSVNSQVQTGLGGSAAGDVKVELSGDHFTIQGAVTNPAGGSASVEGEGTTAKTGSFNAELSIAFDHWKDQVKDMVLDGNLNMSTSSTVSDAAGTTVEVQVNGDLTVSGSVKGSVSIDLSVKTTVSPSGGACVIEAGHVGGVTIDLKQGC